MFLSQQYNQNNNNTAIKLLKFLIFSLIFLIFSILFVIICVNLRKNMRILFINMGFSWLKVWYYDSVIWDTQFWCPIYESKRPIDSCLCGLSNWLLYVPSVTFGRVIGCVTGRDELEPPSPKKKHVLVFLINNLINKNNYCLKLLTL